MFEPQVYQSRRARLRQALPGAAILIPGHGEAPRNYLANTYEFRQHSTFLYLAGHALRVPVLDQLAPAGGETKTGTGQRHAHANTHQQQCRLPHRHRQHQENEKGGQQGRQRNPLHGKVPRKAI